MTWKWEKSRLDIYFWWYYPNSLTLYIYPIIIFQDEFEMLEEQHIEEKKQLKELEEKLGVNINIS